MHEFDGFQLMAEFPSSVPSETPPPQPPLTSVDLSLLEEGKSIASLSLGSTANITVTSTNSSKILGELLGTYIIMFAGCGSVLVHNRSKDVPIIGIAMVWGLVTMTMIYTLGHVSGSHFNPAITIALAVSRKFPWKQVPIYVVSQVVGSVLALLALRVLFDDKIHIDETVTQLISSTNRLKAFGWEFSISFFFMFAVCGVASDQRAVNELSGVVVGATVLFNVIIAGETTGASMNPARSIGPAIVSGKFTNLWIYIFAPMLGTITATAVYCPLRLHPQNTQSVDFQLSSVRTLQIDTVPKEIKYKS